MDDLGVPLLLETFIWINTKKNRIYEIGSSRSCCFSIVQCRSCWMSSPQLLLWKRPGKKRKLTWTQKQTMSVICIYILSIYIFFIYFIYIFLELHKLYMYRYMIYIYIYMLFMYLWKMQLRKMMIFFLRCFETVLFFSVSWRRSRKWVTFCCEHSPIEIAEFEWFGGFLKWWYPQIIQFNRVFHYKPSILGYPYFWKHPFV